MENKTKREQRVEGTKENIVNVAGDLFAMKGITNVAFDDIAKEAGYSRTTVYSHFSSKDDITNYIVLRTMNTVLNAIRKVVKSTAQADGQFRLLCYELVALCDDNPFFFKCMLEYIDASPEGRKNDPVLEEIYQVGEKLNEEFARMLAGGVEQGKFRSDLNVLPTGMILWSCLTSLISVIHNKRQYIEADMLTAEEFLDYGFALILRTVLKDGANIE